MKIWRTVGFGVLASMSAHVAAQTDESASASAATLLEEVVITARRREETLQGLAMSATVFDAQTLIRANISEVADYFLRTPNVSVNESGSRGDNSISMRGISNIGSGPNSSFALNVDEFNVMPLVNNPQLQDVERIEVLRGPQGTFFGRNAAGGAINIVTIKPRNVFEGSTFVGVSSFETYQGGITVNVPVSDSFFVRATGYYSQSDGWIENVNPAGGSNDLEYSNIRLSARYQPNERLTVDTSVVLTDEYNGLESGVPTGKLSVGSIGLWGLNALRELPFFPENRDKVNNDNPKRTDYEYQLFNNRIVYDFGAVSLTSVTGVGDGKRLQRGDVDATSFDAVNLARDSRLDLLSQELRLASNGEGRISWLLGGSWSEQKSAVDLQVILGAFNPLGAPGGTLIRAIDSEGKQRSSALFGEIDYQLNERLTLTYGGRYSRDEVTQSERVLNGTPSGPVIEEFPSISRDFNDYSNKLALRFEWSPSVSAYLLASQGYRSGGIQLDPVLAKSEFEPETLWNYEAGVKASLLEGRLRLAASLFYIDWKDLQVRTLVNGIDPSTGAFVITTGVENAAKASSKGVEFELEGYLTDSLVAGFSFGTLDAKYDDYRDAVIDGAVRLLDLSGKRLLDAPELTVSVFAEQRFRLADWDAFVRLDISHVSEKITSNLVHVPSDAFPVPFDFSFPFKVPSFEVVNLAAGASTGRYSVNAYIKNLADENYYTGTFDDLFASGVHVRTHPREVGMRVGVSF